MLPFSEEEAKDIFTDCSTKTILKSLSEFSDNINELKKKINYLKTIITINDEEQFEFALEEILEKNK